MTFKLDDENEGWMVQTREDNLKARGWKGTVQEWVDECKKLGKDPLTAQPQEDEDTHTEVDELLKKRDSKKNDEARERSQKTVQKPY